MLKSLVVLALVVLGGVFGEERPIVKTKNGLVRGIFKTSTKGIQFAAFEGVPYAQPPVGELRFQEPVPKAPWTGMWDANNSYECLQIDHEASNSGLVAGSEDCLYVNVYSPRVNDVELMDVIVHIHGGAFMFGQGDLYGPKHLMDRNVVFVNLNYRLGPLGFLSTEDEVVPGNNGLKDQVMALKWVNENIKAFGGNPDSITITGLSAGGASVHYHYLSPLSRGLFKRGISFSGTALMNWAFAENPLKKTRQLGLIVGCGQQCTKELVKCLRQRSAQQIIQTVKHFQPWLYNPYSPFAPVVEKAGTNKFLPDTPYNLLKDGKVADLPWITSVTSSEGLYPAADFYDQERLSYLEEHWNEVVPLILHYDTTASPTEQIEISEKIKEYYLKGQPLTRETYAEFVQAVGDRLFVVDAEKTAKLQASVTKSPIYFYRFSYKGDHSISEYYAKTTEDLGVAHADDVMYVLSPVPSWFTTYLQKPNDLKMQDLLLDLWTSYARTGKPSINNVKWTPVSKKLDNQLNYLQISSPSDIKMEKAETFCHRTFWDSLPFQENDLITAVKDEL